MAIQVINVGNLANDGTGDDLREAFIKVNQNFDELDLRAANVEGANVGIGGFTLFKDKVGSTLNFRALQPDPLAPGTVAFRVSDDGNTLFLKSTQATLVFTDGVNTITSNVSEPIIFQGAVNTGAVVSVDNNTKTISIDSQLVRENSPAVSATLNMQQNNIVNCGTINGVNVTDLADVASLDFGGVGNTITSIIDYLNIVTDVDFGTVTSPVNVTLDEGLIVS
jgi:hypothetical protein